MTELPGGTVTFLFSDIESSTRHLRELGDDWEEALTAHNRILRESFAEAGGREVDRQGDAFFAVFPTARTALAAAAAAQRALADNKWPGGEELRVRMGVHTGEPSVGGEGYLGSTSYARPASARPHTAGRCSSRSPRARSWEASSWRTSGHTI